MALGPERLAVILVELADSNAEAKRRLRLELAAQEGGDSIAAEIGKRITALSSARSFVDWQKRREFVRDLDQQRAMIADRVAPIRPDLALDLMWRFLDLAEPVLNRVDVNRHPPDSGGFGARIVPLTGLGNRKSLRRKQGAIEASDWRLSGAETGPICSFQGIPLPPDYQCTWPGAGHAGAGSAVIASYWGEQALGKVLICAHSLCRLSLPSPPLFGQI